MESKNRPFDYVPKKFILSLPKGGTLPRTTRDWLLRVRNVSSSCFARSCTPCGGQE